MYPRMNCAQKYDLATRPVDKLLFVLKRISDVQYV